jgi:hypothetical protein
VLPLAVIEGSIDEWIEAGDQADCLRNAPAVTVGVCRSGGLTAGAGPPPALSACDLRVLSGSASSAHGWNYTCTAEADLDAWLDRIATGVERAPSATLATARLLRLTEDGVPTDAIVLEAFAYSVLQAGPEHRAWLEGRAVR